jgi:uncharacterized protein (DUF2141 family)
MMRQIRVFLLLTLYAAYPLFAQDTGEIRVQARNFRNAGGNVRFLLFSQPDGYPDEPGRAFRSRTVRISNGKAAAVFGSLPPGTYAIALMHDENGNGKLDVGLFGMPLEGYGASNDARGKRGGPSFKDAAFRFDGTRLDVDIETAYMK